MTLVQLWQSLLKKEMIMKDMYEQASRQLIIKMAGLKKELSK
ncbi:Uncharacterised protein [Mannheimia haemolytica]|uniref:Uncharacterized protein n=1 Tax=Mannheimia haemolytica TaxID=75985 RepID=A0A378MZN7_MANHA|nr:Uncharacterised protein [Mannheimia haemolytica]